jgi:Chlorophyll A-B binding protein
MTMDDLPGSINFARQPLKWDPLNLSKTYEPFLPWFRDSELRHGRTAMLAALGFIVPDFVRLPGDVYSFENVPKGVNAHDTLVAMGVASPMFQLLIFIGLWEVIVAVPAAIAMYNGDRDPGDYGMAAYIERNPKYAEKVAYQVDSELLNGRLAMMAVGGMATQNIITGHGFPFV